MMVFVPFYKRIGKEIIMVDIVTEFGYGCTDYIAYCRVICSRIGGVFFYMITAFVAVFLFNLLKSLSVLSTSHPAGNSQLVSTAYSP